VGYTLIECVIVVLIVSVLTLLERRSRSLLLAQSELDRIRAQSIRDYDRPFVATSIAVGGGYLCSASDDQDPSLRTIAVSVGLARRWPGPQ